MEKKTGVSNAIITRSINCKNKKGNRGNDGKTYIFSQGNKKTLTVPRKNIQKINEELRTNKKLTLEKRIDNIKRIGINICSYRVDEKGNLKIITECMCCNEPIDELNYYTILSSQYNLCKECRKIVNRNKQNGKNKYSSRLIDVRPEFFAEYGGQYTYDEKENNNIKLDEIPACSNKYIIVRCKDCKEPRNLQISDITAKDYNGNFKKEYNCMVCYEESIKIKNVFPKLTEMVDIPLQSNITGLSEELVKDSILNMPATSKEKLPITCCVCNKPHDVAIFQIVKQNSGGIKLCSTCKTLMETSFHHIYLLDYFLKTDDDIESEMPINVNGKYLRVDIVNKTKMKAYEICGPQHRDVYNNLNVRAAKNLGITVEEFFEIRQQNDAMKKTYLEEMGYEVIVIDIEETDILTMLSEVSGELITEYPEIDFNKYKRLSKVKDVQDLIDQGYTVQEISNKLKLSRRTIYNYKDRGLVSIPLGSPISN